MSANLKNIEESLKALTAQHKPELSIPLMDKSGQKLINHDTDTAHITLFTEQSAAEVYEFMRRTLGKNPFIVE